MEPYNTRDAEAIENDWILGDEANNGLHKPGLIHKAPTSVRICASFFINSKRYLLLLVLAISAIVATLASAAPAVHAGYMILIMLLVLVVNYLMVRCVLYEYYYMHWRTKGAGALSASGGSSNTILVDDPNETFPE